MAPNGFASVKANEATKMTRDLICMITVKKIVQMLAVVSSFLRQGTGPERLDGELNSLLVERAFLKGMTFKRNGLDLPNRRAQRKE